MQSTGGTVAATGGSANFVAPGTNPTAGSFLYGIVLADIDSDGDLLAGNTQSATVSIRSNDGSGNFSGSQDVVVGLYPYGVALGDVDGDGDLDLLTANSTDVSVRLNQAGSLPTITSFTPTSGLAGTTLSMLEVLDALGRCVATATAAAMGAAQLTLPARLAAGVYVLRGGAQVLRLVLEQGRLRFYFRTSE